MADGTLRAAEPELYLGELRSLDDGTLVTLVARHRNMASRKNEPALLVPRDVERRGLVALLAVTTFAAVQVWGPRKLLLVRILMTVVAARELDLEKRVLTGGRVTLRTGDHGVLPPQRKCCQIVFCEGELRLFESVERVATLALTAVCPARKLPTVRVRVTVCAGVVRNGLLEVTPLVAVEALHFLVLAHQRKLGDEVVEVSRERNRVPRRRCVAGLTFLLE